MADVGEADDGDEIRDGDGRALDVKHAVAFLANQELRGHFKAGTLTSAQYKQIAWETAHQFAVSHVGVRLGNAFRHEVARCFHGKQALLLRPTSLKYAMRHLHSNKNTQAPLQLVFEVIEREQLAFSTWHGQSQGDEGRRRVYRRPALAPVSQQTVVASAALMLPCTPCVSSRARPGWSRLCPRRALATFENWC